MGRPSRPWGRDPRAPGAKRKRPWDACSRQVKMSSHVAQQSMTEQRPWVIALDGPSAAGKGTLARRLAAHYDLAYLDTGSLYRAVGRRVLREGHDPTDARYAA